MCVLAVACGEGYQHLVSDGRAAGDGNRLFIGVKKWSLNMHVSKRRKREREERDRARREMEGICRTFLEVNTNLTHCIDGLHIF